MILIVIKLVNFCFEKVIYLIFQTRTLKLVKKKLGCVCLKYSFETLIVVFDRLRVTLIPLVLGFTFYNQKRLLSKIY